MKCREGRRERERKKESGRREGKKEGGRERERRQERERGKEGGRERERRKERERERGKEGRRERGKEGRREGKKGEKERRKEKRRGLHHYLILTLVDIEFLLCLPLSLTTGHHPHCQHVFAIRVFIVRDIDDMVERVTSVDTLLLGVRHLDTIFGDGKHSLV